MLNQVFAPANSLTKPKEKYLLAFLLRLSRHALYLYRILYLTTDIFFFTVIIMFSRCLFTNWRTRLLEMETLAGISGPIWASILLVPIVSICLEVRFSG